jgi:hypothetical protein
MDLVSTSRLITILDSCPLHTLNILFPAKYIGPRQLVDHLEKQHSEGRLKLKLLRLDSSFHVAPSKWPKRDFFRAIRETCKVTLSCCLNTTPVKLVVSISVVFLWLLVFVTLMHSFL